MPLASICSALPTGLHRRHRLIPAHAGADSLAGQLTLGQVTHTRLRHIPGWALSQVDSLRAGQHYTIHFNCTPDGWIRYATPLVCYQISFCTSQIPPPPFAWGGLGYSIELKADFSRVWHFCTIHWAISAFVFCPLPLRALSTFLLTFLVTFLRVFLTTLLVRGFGRIFSSLFRFLRFLAAMTISCRVCFLV